MNMKLEVDPNLCRVCLKSDNAHVLLVNDLHLREQFFQCTQVQLSPNDGLPQCICSLCHARLRIAYDFRKQCVKADNNLRSFMLRINEQFKAMESITAEPLSNILNGTAEELRLLVEAGFNDSEIVIASDDEKGNFIARTNVSSRDDNESTAGEEDLKIQSADEETNIEFSTHTDDKSDSNAEELPFTTKMKAVAKIDPQVVKVHFADGSVRFKCKICGKLFTQATTIYQSHIYTHTKEKLHKCDVCQRRFPRVSTLRKHFQTKHPNHKKQEYHCVHCSRSYTTNVALQQHIDSRHMREDKPQVCKECGKCFTRKSYLKVHEKIHDPGYIKRTEADCNICNISFASKESLNRHLETHVPEFSIKSGLHFDDGALMEPDSEEDAL